MKTIGSVTLVMMAALCCRVNGDHYCGSKKCSAPESTCFVDKEDPKEVSCKTEKECHSVCDGENQNDCCCYPATESQVDEPLQHCASRWKRGGHSLQCYYYRTENSGRVHKGKDDCKSDHHHRKPACYVLPKLTNFDPTGHYNGKVKQNCWQGDDSDDDSDGHSDDHDRDGKTCEEDVGHRWDACCCYKDLCNKDMKTCRAASGNGSDNGPLGGAPRVATTSVIGVVLAIAGSVSLLFVVAPV